MKPVYLLIFSLLFSTFSYAQVKAGTIVRPRTVETVDSIVYYDAEFTTKQTSYLSLMKGNWEITSMRRQPKVNAETLTHAFLTINEDSTFNGSSGCNQIRGKFILKGTGIKFNNLTATKKACDNTEQESALLGLLQHSVSKYSVAGDKLHFRDGVGNIILEAKRK